MEDLVTQIRNKFQEITMLKNNLHIKDQSASELKRIIEDIVDILNELVNNSNNEDYNNILNRLDHTLDKEIEFVQIKYKAAIKNNAAKIRQKEYEKEFKDALVQIKSDIFPLL